MKQTRKNRRRGGNFTLSALGKAAASVLVPAGLFGALKYTQRGRSVRKVLKRR